jgi:lipid-binding SYLF domain-containing protein
MKARFGLLVFLAALALCLTACGSTQSKPGTAAAEQQSLVDKAKITLADFDSSGDMSSFRDLLKKAKGVLISPEILKGAFFVGGSGGSGVLMVRNSTTGGWSQPAFYTIGAASFGLQVGGQASEVILLAMTDRGVTAMLSSSVKLGGDVGIAAGPVGTGASAATANVSADILSFARSKGLFAGISLDGAVVKVRNEWNQSYYNNPQVTPTDILVKGTATNPHSAGLISELTKDTAKG